MVYPLLYCILGRIPILIKLLFLLVSLFMLCQCTKAVTSPEPIPLAVVKKNVVNPYSLSAASYLARAEKQEGHKKQDLLILAAGRLIFEGQWRQGSAILAQTDELTVDQINEKNLLLAKIDVMRDRPKAALVKLTHIHEIAHLSVYNQIHYHELLAQSYRAVGNNAESISERITLESLLDDSESLSNNRRVLWFTLNHLSEAERTTMTAEAAHQSELQGWLKLALISRQYRTDSKSLLTALEQWQSQYSTHPAKQMLPNPLYDI